MNEIARQDFERLEDKVDKLADALGKLILIEERQSSQGERIGKVEARITAAEAVAIADQRKFDQWINRGIGAWALVAILFAVYKAVRGG